MIELIGRFHPVLVHLPIGILLLASLFQWLVVKESYKRLEPAIGIALFWGMLSAIGSCISGYLLSQSGDYDEQLVNSHQWLGISVAVVGILQYYLYRRSVNAGFAKWIAVILFSLIIITGHLGGSLTRGADYLTKPLDSGSDGKKVVRKPLPDVQSALVYSEVVAPLLEEKCYGCHGPNKQKGKFRLDKPEFIMKGGKEGNDVIAGNTEKSELIKRLLLKRNEDHHMPPKEKPQLNEKEIALLHWWIESGASFDKRVKELRQPERIKQFLLALQQKTEPEILLIPEASVSPADTATLAFLKKRGIAVTPVAENSNYLQVSFIGVDSVTDKDIALLLPLKKQLLALRLSNAPITDEALKIIGQGTALMKLYLDHTKISDKGLIQLQSLANLQYLNLVGTEITLQGMQQLKSLNKLLSIYLYQSAIKPTDWENLKNLFPKAILDSGGYPLPILESDTTEKKDVRK